MIDPGHPRLSVRQCELVSISRTSFYREATPESAENLVPMRLIDEQFLETPWYGSRQNATASSPAGLVYRSSSCAAG
jgi:putative transposase